MSDASEVKRWETIAIDSKIPGVKLDVDSIPRVVVVSAEDHDRVVAELENRLYEYNKETSELKAELVQYYRMASSGVWVETEKYSAQVETIARQAKVIEKLRAALEFIRFDFGGYSEQEMDTGSGYVWEHISGRAKTKARQTLKELEAIEKGEGT